MSRYDVMQKLKNNEITEAEAIYLIGMIEEKLNHDASTIGTIVARKD
jgi:hypothetical protein